MLALHTLNGSRIQRYKETVGKHIAGHIYAHWNYREQILPKFWLRRIEGLYGYHTFAYYLKTQALRLDKAPEFDTIREPYAGEFIQLHKDGRMYSGYSDSIWHHKWLWVMDDYRGFDVQLSYEWSKLWLSKLKESASGRRDIWAKQLRRVGLT